MMARPTPASSGACIAALDASPSRIPVRARRLRHRPHLAAAALRERLGRDAVPVHRRRALRDARPSASSRRSSPSSPFPLARRRAAAPATAREAFDALLALLRHARARRRRAGTFLLDEVLELRTFESFPGLRHVLRELLEALAGSAQPLRADHPLRRPRASRCCATRTARFEVIHLPPLDAGEVTDDAAADRRRRRCATDDRDYLGRAVQALTDGRAAYVRALGDAIGAMSGRGGDPISALTALLRRRRARPAGARFCYELRLHRARGYGALKAILDILAEEEPLTLTEISQRLHRTPGSTKDYLSWLEDVDLVISRQKRYSFTDPLLRLWVRLHCRPVPPTDDDVAREVQRYALARLPQPEPTMAMAGASAGGYRKDAGLIEID